MAYVVKVPESNCLACNAPMNSLGARGSGKPHSGDAVVCIRCGAVMGLDDNLRLRPMTVQERDELLTDREWMNRVAKMVRRVHMVMHMKG